MEPAQAQRSAPVVGASGRSFPPAGGTAWGVKSGNSAARTTSQKLTAQTMEAGTTQSVKKVGMEDVSSSDEEDGPYERPDISRLEASIFGEYDMSEEGDARIEKIRDHLISAQSGATRCLICLEKVGRVASTKYL
jgi:hypothetical protein